MHKSEPGFVFFWCSKIGTSAKRPAERKTRVGTRQKQPLPRVSSRQFGNHSLCNKEKTVDEQTPAPRHGGAKQMTMSSCMCEPTKTALSLGDDTHAAITRPKWA